MSWFQLMLAKHPCFFFFLQLYEGIYFLLCVVYYENISTYLLKKLWKTCKHNKD